MMLVIYFLVLLFGFALTEGVHALEWCKLDRRAGGEQKEDVLHYKEGYSDHHAKSQPHRSHHSVDTLLNPIKILIGESNLTLIYLPS